MLKMLTEVIGAEKLLGLVAFAKLVIPVQVTGALIPIGWLVAEFCAAVAAGVVCGWYRVWLTRDDVRIGEFRGGKESIHNVLSKDGTGPGVPAKVEGILMTLHFIFVFKSIGAILTAILLFCFVLPWIWSARLSCN